VLEWNLIREQKNISTGDFNELGVATVAMFSDHLPFDAELLVTAEAEVTATAADQIVDIDTIVR
jgi:hypothetical protein